MPQAQSMGTSQEYWHRPTGKVQEERSDKDKHTGMCLTRADGQQALTSSLRTMPEDMSNSPKSWMLMPRASLRAKSMPDCFNNSMLSWAYISSDSLNSLQQKAPIRLYRPHPDAELEQACTCYCQLIPHLWGSHAHCASLCKTPSCIAMTGCV